MSIVFMKNPAADTAALYDEAPGGDDVRDVNSLRNRPLVDPVSWLSLVRFHADFDYYQVSHGPTDVVVNHASVASASTNISSVINVIRVGQVVETHYDMVTHGLGVVPRYMVAWNDALLTPGTMVQTESGARSRRVTPYATTDKIRLMDVGISQSSALSAISLTYRVLVFKPPTADSDHLYDFDKATGRVILGKGKFDSALKMLRQAGAGDSPFDIALGPTMHIRNGRTRTVLPDGTTITETGYTGSFAGSPSLECAVD